jgi:hypothetical protein
MERPSPGAWELGESSGRDLPRSGGSGRKLCRAPLRECEITKSSNPSPFTSPIPAHPSQAKSPVNSTMSLTSASSPRSIAFDPICP